MERNSTIGAALLLGLLAIGAVAAAAASDGDGEDLHLGDFVKRAKAIRQSFIYEPNGEYGSMGRRVFREATKFFVGQFRDGRTIPLKRREITERVRKQGLAWLEDDKTQKAVLGEEGAKAMGKAIGYVQWFEAGNSFPWEYWPSKVVDSCCSLVNELESQVFGHERLKALLNNGQLEQEVRKECERQDVADFLSAWAQFDTCKLLCGLTPDQRKQLVDNTIGICGQRYKRCRRPKEMRMGA